MSEWDDTYEDFSTDWPVLVGVWADRTHVHRGRAELTVDFVRLVPRPVGRALVARAIVAPHLRDQLDEAWRDYDRWPMPGADS